MTKRLQNRDMESVGHLPNPDCVIKVGDGRGFIIVHRVKLPPAKLPPLNLRHLGLTRVSFMGDRLVVTAAHCLPQLPPAHAFTSGLERTYERLLGSLDGSKKDVWAECLFADPVADIAVLGCPDTQELGDEADAYYSLTDDISFLRIGRAESGRGWVLDLDGQWIPTTLEVFSRTSLSIDPTEPGMSGSPILSDAGLAVGMVVVGTVIVSENGERENERAGRQPILVHDLPGWLLPKPNR
jgi:hypothetical protein